MKNIIILFLLVVSPIFSNTQKVPSQIKEVTVYLSGAEITRTALCLLKEGSNEIVFTGLSHKIDESSIQVSGLNAVSILSLNYNINYLEKVESEPQFKAWEEELKRLEHQISLLKNQILGWEEEEKVITTNRMVSTDNQALSLEKVKEISRYYRERITAIKNEIFETNLEINRLNLETMALQRQMAEVNNAPEKEQGEITIKFDAPIATQLEVTLKYLVKDAGWVPNYDIKSKAINTPLKLTYKANVYQKTGQDWNNVKVVLSTGNPQYNIAKPKLESHYLNFVSAYKKRYAPSLKKKGYAYNPSVKKVVGVVTDASGMPLPGANVVIKGTTHGTTTDFDGNYTLNIPYGQELVFSYIGQVTQELPLYSSIINVQMEEDATALDEVVVVGYGEADSSVSAEQLIQGRTAGIQVRGISTMKSQPEPLYIIDGVPVDDFVEGDLDASEIQDIEILKGAGTAIYGSRGIHGVVVITTKKSTAEEGATKTEFAIKKNYSIPSNGDITAVEINSFSLVATYEYFAAPIINENVFLTAGFTNWEKHQLLPGEANIYFEGTYAGKTVLDPYVTKKEMILSLGIDPNITVTRKQERNFKSKSFTGSNRILNRTYNLEIKNNKGIAIDLRLLDRIPKSQNKEIRVSDIVINEATYETKKGILTWTMHLKPKENKTVDFSFQVKYPRGKYISL